MIWQLWNIPSIPLVNHVPIAVLLYIDFFRSNVRSPGVLLNIIDPHLIAGYSLVSGTFFSPKKATQKKSRAVIATLQSKRSRDLFPFAFPRNRDLEPVNALGGLSARGPLPVD